MTVVVDFKRLIQEVTCLKALHFLGWRETYSRWGKTRGKCPFHPSDNPRSTSLKLTKGVWYCHKCKRGGDVVGLWAEIHNISNYAAALELVEIFNLPSLLTVTGGRTAPRP